VKTLRPAASASSPTTCWPSPLSLSPGITGGARRYTAACEKIKASERKKKRPRERGGQG
jgi:hypothetical protein